MWSGRPRPLPLTLTLISFERPKPWVPILTSCFSTLEPALSGVEGAGFQCRRELWVLAGHPGDQNPMDEIVVESHPCAQNAQEWGTRLLLLLNVTEAIKDAVHVIRLVGVGHFPLQGFEFVVQIADASATCDRFMQNGTTLHFLDVLAKVADRQLLGDRDRALVGSFLANHTIRKSVVLPAPLGPTSPTFSPGFN